MLARHQVALRQFCWVTQTKVVLNQQLKKSSRDLCRYGPDGRVYRTPLDAPSPRKTEPGLRRRVVEIKADGIQNLLDAALALTHTYVPLHPERLVSLYQSGSVLFVRKPDSNLMQLQFRDYAMPGDLLVIKFDPGANSLHSMDVVSYLSEQKDIAVLRIIFESLPDGTNYVASSVLSATGGQLQLITENVNYQKVWQ
jgi:hypothetical protein